MRPSRRARLAFVALAALVPSSAHAQEGVPSGATPASEGRAERRLTKAPKLTSNAPAVFPPSESRAATVVLALTITAKGEVSGVEVLESAGAAFDAAAVDAARRFAFEPAEVDGHPAAVKIRYVYAFTPPPPRLAPVAPAPPVVPPPAAPSPSPPVEQDVVVRGSRRPRDANEVTVSATEAGKVVGTQGDPIKVVENLPGLARPAFGSGQLVVWGSAPSETRTYVDGVEIPALFHGSGLRSTVNGDLVRDVSLTPGAYAPDYGRSLGGIVRVETRDLPAGGVHGYVGADTLDGSAMVTTPLGDRARLAVAGRYGWLDAVLGAVGESNVDTYVAVPRYRDAQAKLQLRLREGESLDVVALGSGDDLTQAIPDADPAHARSETTSQAYERIYLRYRRADKDGSIDVVPWFGRDRSRLDARFGADPAVVDQTTWRGGLRASHRSRLGPTAELTLGIDLDGSSAHVTRTGSMSIPPREGDVSVFGQPPGGDTNTDTWGAGVVDVGPYALVDLDFGPLRVSPGLRVDGLLLEASRQTPRVGQTPSIGLTELQGEVEPRASARLRIDSRLSLLAAAGLYSQPPDPADLSAVFGNPRLGPSSAEHMTFGEVLRVTDTLSVEAVAFYKAMHDLAVRDPSPNPKLAQALASQGVGRSYGLQVLVRQRAWRGFYGWVAYTLSRSERLDAPGGSWRLFDYDQPHVLTVVATKELGPWSFGARLRFATGLPRTPVTGAFYDTKDDAYEPIFGAHNTLRLPDFWQLDLRVDRSFLIQESVRVLLYLEGLNVTNHSNGEEYVYNVDYSRRGTITGLPIVAVLGARVEL